jgi:hypothetical protein
VSIDYLCLILDNVNKYAVMAYTEREAATAFHSAIEDNRTERNEKMVKVLLFPSW